MEVLNNDEVIEGFKPRFKSLSKDSSRYFDALIDLNDKGVIETKQVLELSAKGSLWIIDQYLDNGHEDMVIANLQRDVTSRDFYGDLFENSLKTMDKLKVRSRTSVVIATYRMAIDHRLKAIKGEVAIIRKSKPGSQAHSASKKWVAHYFPSLRKIIADYSTLLEQTGSSDPDLPAIKAAIEDCSA